MTLARFLAAALLLCSLSAFAQDHPKRGGVPGGVFDFFSGPCWVPPSTPSEPWKIIPNQPAPLNYIQAGQYPSGQSNADCIHLFTQDGHRASWIVRSEQQMDAVGVCYAIRSYVVARDSKDSDSTHPVSYSTCQPAARYQLKTTEIRTVTVDR
jgi:hypothetical protein